MVIKMESIRSALKMAIGSCLVSDISSRCLIFTFPTVPHGLEIRCQPASYRSNNNCLDRNSSGYRCEIQEAWISRSKPKTPRQINRNHLCDRYFGRTAIHAGMDDPKNPQIRRRRPNSIG